MADYLPTSNDEAQRVQLVSQFFWTAGDLLAGTDTVMRMDPGAVRNDGLMGVPGSAVSYGVAPDGTLYVRGTAGSVGAAQDNTGSQAAAGMVLSPGLLILAALLFAMLKS